MLGSIFLKTLEVTRDGEYCVYGAILYASHHWMGRRTRQTTAVLSHNPTFLEDENGPLSSTFCPNWDVLPG